MGIDAVSGSSASLSLAEMMQQSRKEQPSFEEMAQSILEKDDTDGDGVLSLEETPLDADRFSEIDADEDGFITAEELSADAENHAAQGPEAMGAGQGAPPSGSGSESSESEEEYDQYDLNEDGVVSMDELLQAFNQGDNTLKTLFESMDSTASSVSMRLGIEAYQAQSLS